MSDAPVGATAARPVPRAIAAGLARAGGLLTWNVSNVGAVADPLADAYGVSLAVVGLLTTALFVTHLAAQLPGRHLVRPLRPASRGARRLRRAALGNALVLADDDVGVARVGRLVVGLGSGAGFVAGLDLVRAGGGGPVLQGATAARRWRAAGSRSWSCRRSPTRPAGGRRTRARSRSRARRRSGDPVRGLDGSGARGGACSATLASYRSASLQAATFGLAVIAGNWVVPLLERRGGDVGRGRRRSAASSCWPGS